MTLQIKTTVGTAAKGSIIAVAGSGIRSISDSWICWKPRMEEPSNPIPSVNRSSVNSRLDMEKCCHRPGRSMNLKSTIFAPCSFATPTGPDSDNLIDRHDKDLSVSNATGLRRRENRLHNLIALIVGNNDLDLHLGQKVYGVFTTPVQFGVPFLPTKTLDLAYGEALNSRLRQSALHLIKLEGLNDRLDLLHPPSSVSEGACLPVRGPIPPLPTPPPVFTPTVRVSKSYARSEEH